MSIVYKKADYAADIEKLQRAIFGDSAISEVLTTLKQVNQTCDVFTPLSSTRSTSPRLGEVYYASATRIA